MLEYSRVINTYMVDYLKVLNFTIKICFNVLNKIQNLFKTFLGILFEQIKLWNILCKCQNVYIYMGQN